MLVMVANRMARASLVGPSQAATTGGSAFFIGSTLANLRASWLPKEYARYGWWIQVRPVIDHPEFAADATHFKRIPEAGGVKQFYSERAKANEEPPVFPRECIIDVHARRLLTLENKAIVRNDPIDRELWT